jgi:hypothetical protein
MSRQVAVSDQVVATLKQAWETNGIVARLEFWAALRSLIEMGPADSPKSQELKQKALEEIDRNAANDPLLRAAT